MLLVPSFQGSSLGNSFLLMAGIPLKLTLRASAHAHLGHHWSYAIVDNVAMAILLYVLLLGYCYISDIISYSFTILLKCLVPFWIPTQESH